MTRTYKTRLPSAQATVDPEALSPAARLVIAILHQAAYDYAAGDLGAAAFIRGRHFNFYCDLIGANPDYLRRRITRDLPPRRRPEVHP